MPCDDGCTCRQCGAEYNWYDLQAESDSAAAECLLSDYHQVKEIVRRIRKEHPEIRFLPHEEEVIDSFLKGG